MKRFALLAAALLATGAMLSCAQKPGTEDEATTIHWPPGDAERGRTAFVDLGCASCHQVMGAELPKPSADPPVPLVLAGARSRDRTTAQVITAIVNPSHEIAPTVKPEQAKSGDKSRMGDYGHVMTVQQLVDVVEFLGATHGWHSYGDR